MVLPETQFLLVTTSCDERGPLERIAARLVEQRLAACAQLSGPVTSTYRWEGQVESAAEWLLQIKTRADLWGAVVAAIAAEHPYQVPELVATPLVAVAEAYARWLEDSLQRL